MKEDKYYLKMQYIYLDDEDQLLQHMGKDFAIENSPEDVFAFQESLRKYSCGDRMSKPIDAYPFEVAELFLQNGFNLKMHRHLLNEEIIAELNEFVETTAGVREIKVKPDGRGSVFLIKHHAHILYLSGDDEETALDLVYAKFNKSVCNHPIVVPYLEQAGCKRSEDLTHQERVYASSLNALVVKDNLDDVQYFLDTFPDLSQTELLDAANCLINSLAKKLELPKEHPNGFEFWFHYLTVICGRIKDCAALVNNRWWFVQTVMRIVQREIDTSHVEHQTDIRLLKFIIKLGVQVNQIDLNKTALDFALEYDNQRLAGFLRALEVKTFAELKQAGLVVKDEDDFWVLKPE